MLDGFPRNLAQAEALDTMLVGIGRSLDAILFFGLPEHVARERLLRRAREEGRPDDTPEVDRPAARDVPRRDASRWSSTTARRGCWSASTPSASVGDVFAEIQHALDAVEAR